MSDGIHAAQPMSSAGSGLDDAGIAVLLFHGRGSDPASMLDLAGRLDLSGCAVLAPAAAASCWYPQSFLKPLADNEPDLSSALGVVTRLVMSCVQAGISRDRIVLGGFSQGACLAAEWTARNPDRYGALVVLSGGLMGPSLPEHEGSLHGTPVLLGCSDVDPWIPLARVHETHAELERMGASVDLRLFAGAEHSIRDEEAAQFGGLLDQLRATSPLAG